MFTETWRIAALAAPFVLLAACGGGGGGSSPAPAPTANAPAQPANPAPDPAQTAVVEIRLLALFSPGIQAQFPDPDLRIQHLVNVTNDVLQTSGVDLRFVAEHVEAVDYPDGEPVETALDDLTAGTHPSLNEVHALRDATGADLVVLFRPYANDGHCGYAWIGGYRTQGDFTNPVQPDYGYSVVVANCSDYTLLHELGHNLGLAHSRREDPVGGTFEYALGHGVDGDFVTIMASPTEFSGVQLPRMSSPWLDCNGQPCGVPHTDELYGSDAVRALAVTAPQVAAYR